MLSDPLFPVLLALRYLHIFGAIALFGGSIFAWFAVVPSLATLKDEERKNLHQMIRDRWKWVVHMAVFALLLSGIANLGLAARYTYDGPVSYNMLAGIKFLLALPIFFIAEMLVGRSALSQKFREKVGFWLSVNLALATVLVLMGGFMRFIPREPKPPKTATINLVQPAELRSLS